jgi:trigger factor
MQYELRVEEQSSFRRLLHFQVPAETVDQKLKAAYADLQKKARVPGFRPGKVTQRVLEERYGEGVRAEVTEALINESYRKAAHALDVVGKAQVEQVADLKPTAQFSFVVGVDVRPAVTVEGYRGIEVGFQSTPVDEQEVQQALSDRLARKAKLVEVTEDRPVQAGDRVLVSLRIEADGEVQEVPGTMISTVGERFYPGLETLLLGASKGATVEGSVSIGAGALSNYAGKTVQVKAEINSLQSRQAPTLDDELAKEMGAESAEAYVASLRDSLQEERDTAARNNARIELLQKLIAKNVFDVPGALVDEQLENLTEEMKVRRAYSGQDPRSIRFSEAEMRDLRSRATFAAKAGLVLAAIARQESIVVTDEDVDAKIAEIAASRGQTAHAIRGYLEREGGVSILRDRLLEEKSLEWLFENAELVSPAGAAEAAAPEVEAAPEAEAAAEVEAAPAEDAG